MGCLQLVLSKTNRIIDTKYNISVMSLTIVRAAICKMLSIVRLLPLVDPIAPQANFAYHPSIGLILSSCPFSLHSFDLKAQELLHIDACILTVYVLRDLFGVLNFNRTNSWNFLGNVSSTMNWWASKGQMTSLGSKCHLRYVGVIWFVFHVLQLLPIRFTQQNSCCISKSMIKHL